MKKKLKKNFISLILVGTLILSNNSFLMATSVEEAQNKVDSISNSLSNKEAEVNEIQTKLTDLIGKILELETTLTSKGEEVIKNQEDLKVEKVKEKKQYSDMKSRIKYLYEGGSEGMLASILGAESIGDMLNKAEYATSMTKYDKEKLDEYALTRQRIKNINAKLETEIDELESLNEEYANTQTELNTLLSEKQSELDNFNALLQGALSDLSKAKEEEAARQRAAEEERKRAEEIAAAAAAAAAASSASSGNSGNSSSPEPAYNQSTGNAVVDRAYSKLGSSYVWGACSPNAFDCSGFVSYCLTGAYQRIGWTGSFMTWPQVSNPQPGDVCVNWTHTGIYIGNGQMIHAACEGVGVIVGPVQAGMIYVRY